MIINGFEIEGLRRDEPQHGQVIYLVGGYEYITEYEYTGQGSDIAAIRLGWFETWEAAEVFAIALSGVDHKPATAGSIASLAGWHSLNAFAERVGVDRSVLRNWARIRPQLLFQIARGAHKVGSDHGWAQHVNGRTFAGALDSLGVVRVSGKMVRTFGVKKNGRPQLSVSTLRDWFKNKPVLFVAASHAIRDTVAASFEP